MREGVRHWEIGLPSLPISPGLNFSAGPQLIHWVNKRKAAIQFLGTSVSSPHDRTILRFR